MIADLHAHYPMHVDDPPGLRRLKTLWARRGEVSGWTAWVEWIRGLLTVMVSPLFNYQSICSGARAPMKYLREGEVGVALSVLYQFFDEVLDPRVLLEGPEPHTDYRQTVIAQLERIECHVEAEHSGRATYAHNPAEIKAAREAGLLALVHCLEGGFALGDSPGEVRNGVAQLAELGVAYVTLAHLFWRGVATDAPALPMFTDEQYHRLFKQPEDVGLSDLGYAAVEAMVDHRMLIDLSHMSERALKDTLDWLDDHDKERTVPVIATHAGYRFGEQEYMLSEPSLQRIKERDGVVGLIFAKHQIEDGDPLERRRPRLPAIRRETQFRRSFEILQAHIDEIYRVMGRSHRHTAIGSDLDGFIRPTLSGLQDMRSMKPLADELVATYKADGEAIAWRNALRPLMTYWRGGRRGDFGCN